MSATATLPPPRQTRVAPWARLSDETLAGRAAGGNNAAFTALYERYYGPLLGYTRSILLDAEDAHDATQNALESALRALPSRECGRPLRPWLYKIAHNEAIDIIRRRRPQTELSDAFEPQVPGPEVGFEQRGRLAQLVDDLQTLPERQRGALVMRELNGLSYDEIGGALGLTNEAARRAVFDARSALHAAAAGHATECVSVRHCISDGDRRGLRARGMRAHLRSCNDCASFQRSIGARTSDLHVFAPWVSGAAVLSALGLTSAGGGAAMLTAASATTAGGGITWAGLPLAVKGLAVAAAVATTGTAAVEVKRVAAPESRTSAAAATQPRGEHARANALRVATRAASALGATPASARARTRADRIRTSTGTAHSMTVSNTTSTADRDTPALAPASTAPAARAPASSDTSSAVPVVKTPEQVAAEKLAPLRDAVEKAFADAAAIASRGTTGALTLAKSILDSTLGPLRIAINAVLAPLGMALPAASAPAPQTQSPATTIFAPVQYVLSGIQDLLANLLGGR